MSLVDIAEFLTARLDEDEQMARAACTRHVGTWAASDGEVFSHIGLDSPSRCPDHPAGEPNLCDDVRVVVVDDDLGGDEAEDAAIGEHVARHDPARALAEVAAKRAIVQRLHHSLTSGIRGGEGERYAECVCGWERILSDRERYDDIEFYQRHLDSLGVTETVAIGVLRVLAQPYADHAEFDPSWAATPS